MTHDEDWLRRWAEQDLTGSDIPVGAVKQWRVLGRELKTATDPARIAELTEALRRAPPVIRYLYLGEAPPPPLPQTPPPPADQIAVLLRRISTLRVVVLRQGEWFVACVLEHDIVHMADSVFEAIEDVGRQYDALDAQLMVPPPPVALQEYKERWDAGIDLGHAQLGAARRGCVRLSP